MVEWGGFRQGRDMDERRSGEIEEGRRKMKTLSYKAEDTS